MSLNKVLPIVEGCEAFLKVVSTDPIYTLNFDGCSKGNPGRGGAGAVIYKDQEEIWAGATFVGANVTNNYAEYSGLILGLKTAIKLKIKNLDVLGDSDLVIKQMKKIYKVKSPNIYPLYLEANDTAKAFDKIEFTHVYRENNKRADELSNDGLDLEICKE
uniref:RNase H type-1 domain-containing protein n=1 Tax=viral metagenome TaxID=1070528 RepID=A0A6C0F3V1_9ZZZZ